MRVADRETSETAYRSVGKPIQRGDATGKVTGKTAYADDLLLPHMLHIKVLGAAHAHAHIKSIDTSKARLLPGVEAVVTAGDLPPYKMNESNRRGLIFPKDEVLFFGQPIAAVLAEDPHVAEEALSLIKVEYNVLPPVIDPVAAIREDSPLVRTPLHDVDRSEERGHVTVDVQEKEATGKPTNIASTMNFKRGDVEAGFAEADCVIERTWRSAMVHQSYIEPHSTIADYDASGESDGLDEHPGAVLHPRRTGPDAGHPREPHPRDRHRGRRRLRRQDIPDRAHGRRARYDRPAPGQVHHEPSRGHALGDSRALRAGRTEDRHEEGRHAHRPQGKAGLRFRRLPRRARPAGHAARRRLLQVPQPGHPGPTKC